ncbi:ATP-binding protein [Plantactinospora sp. CA-290183]|uniref:ATP-binding protein n=1 Tax=Plantactinospora sp. CA-290183 TaxID=3240006 RepID=UPI003D8A079C
MSDGDPHAPPATLPVGSTLLFVATFERDEVTAIRHSVAAHAEANGLHGSRLDDFVLAANELITNAIRHGGGRGFLRLWHVDGVVHCTVSDTGAGMDSGHLDDRRPGPDAAGGWGLWLARQLSDSMLVETGPAGTTVRITARLREG